MAIGQVRKGSSELLLLGLLHEKPLHGYGLQKAIGARSGGKLHLQDGRLYPVLTALEQKSYVTSDWVGAKGGRRKRVYSITDSGVTLLQELLQEWLEFFGILKAVVPLLGEFENLYVVHREKKE